MTPQQRDWKAMSQHLCLVNGLEERCFHNLLFNSLQSMLKKVVMKLPSYSRQRFQKQDIVLSKLLN